MTVGFQSQGLGFVGYLFRPSKTGRIPWMCWVHAMHLGNRIDEINTRDCGLFGFQFPQRKQTLWPPTLPHRQCICFDLFWKWINTCLFESPFNDTWWYRHTTFTRANKLNVNGEGERKKERKKGEWESMCKTNVSWGAIPDSWVV